jgi:hypothetical protein
MFYSSELILQDTKLRFGYADNILLYRASDSLQENTYMLANDFRGMLKYGQANKIIFAPEKLELQYIARKRNSQAQPYAISDEPIVFLAGTSPPKAGIQYIDGEVILDAIEVQADKPRQWTNL